MKFITFANQSFNINEIAHFGPFGTCLKVTLKSGQSIEILLVTAKEATEAAYSFATSLLQAKEEA